MVANFHSVTEIAELTACLGMTIGTMFEAVACNSAKVSGKGASKATLKTGTLMAVLHCGV